ncbi:hypothetical protein AB3S75_032911 [Citrus x aurantiifolia]
MAHAGYSQRNRTILYSRMLGCHRKACVCALIAACIILSMSSWPLLIEARIPEFGAIQGSLIRQSMTEHFIRRSLRRITNRLIPPTPDPGNHQHG